MSTYVRADRGHGPRSGQLLRHKDDPKRWQVKVFLYRDENGRKRYRTEVVHGGKRDAEARLLELLKTKSDGNLTPRTKMTLRDLTNEWAKHKVRDVAPRTLQGYEYSLHRYVLPTLGHRKLIDLTLRDIDTLYGAMLAGELPKPGGKRGEVCRPLSARTVRLTHAALSQALSQAVKWGLLQHNPAAEASIPSHKSREKIVLTASERTSFLRACEGSFYGVLFRLLIDTGLRPGEACALKWTDVDFTRGAISVQRAVTRGKGSEAIIAEPKTVKSRRTIPLFASLREVLLKHQAWQRERNLHVSGLVFTNTNGEILRPWTFSTRDLFRTLKAAGIMKHITLYSLRHTFATLHVHAGTPLKIVQDVLGHATIQQTANTYMHGDPSVTADWMQKFEQAIDTASPEARAPVN
jgi:integrase